MAKTEIRNSVYAQIGDMGWREKIDGTWTDPYGDPDYVCRSLDAARLDDLSISAFGLYVDFSNDGHPSLARVYTSREAAERAQRRFVATGMVP